MKPIVVNQEYEVLPQLSSSHPSNFPHKELPPSVIHQSYATVLEQALTTKDKQIVREILSYDSTQIIYNTIIGLSPSKVSLLL